MKVNIADLPIIEDENMTYTISVPRKLPKTKRKRVVKKWKTRYGHKLVHAPRKDALIFHNAIICHPALAHKLREAISLFFRNPNRDVL